MSSLKFIPEPEKQLWQSLDDLEPKDSRSSSHAEFSEEASVWTQIDDSVSRRRFLQLIGASAALAGFSACIKMPAEKIIPYIVAPEELVPGKPRFFATACSFNGYAKPILAESHEGRPTKLEGNPRHPASLGKSDPYTQAELLQLYDPERAQTVLYRGKPSNWDEFNATILKESHQWKRDGGKGIRVLSNSITSPTLLSDLSEFLRIYPKAQWHSYDPIHSDSTRKATQLLFKKELRPLYDFKKATTILSFDHDFLGPSPVRETWARDFMSLRNLKRNSGGSEFNRLYVIEPSVSLTGAVADHRWPVKPSELLPLAQSLAVLLGVPGFASVSAGQLSALNPPWLKVIATELLTKKGQSLITVGEQSSVEIQTLVFAMNEFLGNVGKSIQFIPYSEDAASIQSASLSTLIHDLENHEVKAIFILGSNPVYDTPSTLKFKELFNQVPLRVHMSLHPNETSYSSHWHLPESHFLESWGDIRAWDGTVSLVQPLISPLYESRTSVELFSILIERPGRNAFQAVRQYWKQHLKKTDSEFEAFFEQSLQDGWIKNTSFTPEQIRSQPNWKQLLPTPAETHSALEGIFKPDPTIWDGRYSNNAWLQELPKPILQLTWDNVVAISPMTAKALSLEDEDQIEIVIENRQEKAAVLRVPGHPDGSVTLYFGYGRTRAGEVGNHLGYNAYSLQNHQSPYFAESIQIKKLGKKIELATTHTHSKMEGRDLVVFSKLSQFQKDPNPIVKEELKKSQPTLLPEYSSDGEAWAMVIDLTTCIGCKACTIACQAENNIPTVGKEQVRKSREMHWIRVDRYFHGSASNPQVFFQPVPCMHCEKAPCELVCPTVATNHSSDGLNQMVYNRCVGTRYCSNNCPYKVRRFNFYQYSDTKAPSIQMMQNPDVTIRSRGVMEKCTYCIQRIQSVRIEAEIEDRAIRDGEILTACQQACPTDAIIFGNQNDPNSQVAKFKRLPHHYSLLNELGTRPRTTYLALIKNTHPALGKEGS